MASYQDRKANAFISCYCYLVFKLFFRGKKKKKKKKKKDPHVNNTLFFVCLLVCLIGEVSWFIRGIESLSTLSLYSMCIAM